MTTHFWGPMANWGLALSGIYDASMKGPEIINERMSATQVLYSGLFVRFAWKVQPRNYLLASCHTANVCAQTNQLRRWVEHIQISEPETGPQKVKDIGMIAAGVGVVGAGVIAASGPLQKAMMSSKAGLISGIAMAPAGPFHIHFWAPNFKWALSINNLLDIQRPVDKISLSMTSALTLTGVLFMRWSFVITPVNYSLFAVNAALASSSGFLLARKVKADYLS
eukprot:CAMPEP_0170599732 /NCGR_PEP_ID=MMETSP0224-20130122/16959_1 /TAXON_ID=285029 /ORGANISM="Togula jolla, Strain CCCM 725" /LENGTH=222 /DNA_ID=CAMNT_0010924413 /DNA_START=115 /DNA_END=783 /DNA_ORIENTATION=+